MRDQTAFPASGTTYCAKLDGNRPTLLWFDLPVLFGRGFWGLIYGWQHTSAGQRCLGADGGCGPGSAKRWRGGVSCGRVGFDCQDVEAFSRVGGLAERAQHRGGGMSLVNAGRPVSARCLIVCGSSRSSPCQVRVIHFPGAACRRSVPSAARHDARSFGPVLRKARNYLGLLQLSCGLS